MLQCLGLSDFEFKTLMQRGCPNLQTLDMFSSCRMLTDDSLKEIGEFLLPFFSWVFFLKGREIGVVRSDFLGVLFSLNCPCDLFLYRELYQAFFRSINIYILIFPYPRVKY